MRKLIRLSAGSMAGLARATALMTVATVMVAFVIGGVASAAAARLWTAQGDYTPESTVQIYGAALAPGTYAVPVLRPDGSIVKGDGTFTPGWDEVTTTARGSFTYDYQLDGVLGEYEVRAYPAPWSGDWSESPAASFVFHDGPGAANLDQCRNGSFLAPVECTGAAWSNGNANADTAHWREGDSIPYRIRFTGLSTTGNHTETFSWDTTKTGKHAIDYVTSYDRTEATADPCSGVAGCGSPSTFPIPLDPSVLAAGVTQEAGVFTCFDCTITAVSTYTLTGSYAGTSSTQITVTFSAATATPVLAWGGHIASQFDWGSGHSASSIGGSPYHTNLIDLDGNGGNQDRGLQSGAVVGPPTITTDVSASTVSPGASVTDHAALSGTNGAVTGTVTFFACGPDVAAPDCTTGGTQVGSPVTIVAGEATSDPFTPGSDPSAAGFYCFRAEYAPDASAQYSLGKHTDTTLECFEQLAAGISITKVADDPDPVPSDTIGFLITVTSPGPGTATNVQLNDTLPTNLPDVSWYLDGGTGQAFCDVASDVLTCNFGDMIAGASYTIHVSSTTSADTMGRLTNTAYVTTSNVGNDDATATIYLKCPGIGIHVIPDAATVNVGDSVGFTITVNAIGNTLKSLVVTSNLPRKVSPWAIDPASDPGCSISSDVLTCNWGDLPWNQVLSVHITSSPTQAIGMVGVTASGTAISACKNRQDTDRVYIV